MVSPRKLLFGLIYGLTAGLVFAVAAWGVNAFLLSRAHFAYPWLTFLLGLLPVMLISGLAGYLAIRIGNAFLGGLIWAVAGILLAIIGVWLPLWIVPELIPKLAQLPRDWLAFYWLDSYTFLVYSAAIVGAIAFLIAGVLESVLVDQASFSPYSGALIMPLLVCAIITAVIGGVVDNMVNVRFRNSALALDRLMTFAVENKGIKIDPATARGMHLGAVSAIQTDLSEKRRMFYFSFTETAEQGQILVDLNGHWALCDVFMDQPAFCRTTTPPG